MSGNLIKQLVQSIHGTVAPAEAVLVAHAMVHEVALVAAELDLVAHVMVKVVAVAPEAVIVALAKEVEVGVEVVAVVTVVVLLAAVPVAPVAVQVSVAAPSRMQRLTADAKARPGGHQQRHAALERGQEGSA